MNDPSWRRFAMAFLLFFASMTILTAFRWPPMQDWIGRHPVWLAVITVIVLIIVLGALRWPSKWIALSSLEAARQPPSPEDRRTIAEVHASIISILFGAIWIYASNAAGTVQQLEEKALQEAKRIKPSSIPRFGFSGMEPYTSYDQKSRMALVNRLNKLLFGEHMGERMHGNLAAAGRHAILMIDALASVPPFGGTAPTSLDGIRQWVSEVKPLAQELLWGYERGRRHLESYLDALDTQEYAIVVQQEQERIQQLTRQVLPHLSQETAEDLLRRNEATGNESLHRKKKRQQSRREYMWQFYDEVSRNATVAESLGDLLRDIESFRARRLTRS
jgi:hypothetical protein